MTDGWQPIATYPRDADEWGEDALVLVPSVDVEIDGKRRLRLPPFAVVAHMEGGMWLSRNPTDPVCWDELIDEPTHWLPLPAALPSRLKTGLVTDE